MSQTWFKCYTEVINDPKLIDLPLDQRCCWFLVMAVAAKCDNGDHNGRLEAVPGDPMTDQAIEATAAIPHDTWVLARDAFLRRGMLARDGNAYVIPRYGKRQSPKDPTATERQRRHREKNVTHHRDITAVSRVNLRVEAEAEADNKGSGSRDCIGAPETAPPPLPAPPRAPNPESPAGLNPPQWARDIVTGAQAVLDGAYPNRTKPSNGAFLLSAAEVNRLHAQDGKPQDLIRSVWLWAAGDRRYWAGRIQTGKALSDHWNQVLADYEAADGKPRGAKASEEPAPMVLPKARRSGPSPMEMFARNDAAARAQREAAAAS